ncbi:MAG: PTS sugar transporter subunit IIB [Mycoplasmatales bacterium]
MNLYLFCDAGMSTSLMVTKMQKAAEEKGIEATIQAFPLSSVEDKSKEADVVLLGPQVKYMLDDVKKKVTDKPVMVIDMQQYGMMQGDKVLDQALELV